MVVEAISNRAVDVPLWRELPGVWPPDEAGVFSISPGRRYVVYAERCRHGQTTWAVGDDDVSVLGYPVWYAPRLFRVVDDRLPEDWIVGRDRSMEGILFGKLTRLVSFPEWVRSDGHYYHWLMEGRPPEVAVFVRRLQEYTAAYSSLMR